MPTEREDKLRKEIAQVHEGGPAKYREKLSQEGKLFVRERLRLFFPDGPDFEDGVFANFLKDGLPADGMITGAGTIDTRKVFFVANDYTVKAGSMAEKGVEKFLRTQERAIRANRPMLYLIDSSGGRITDQTGFFANRHGVGKYFYNHAIMSGRVPQVCVMYGPCVAGAAYTPVFCDFVVMVKGTSAMVIASPRMVEMVTGEKISMEDLGGAQMHATLSGSCDLVAEDEEDAAFLVSRLLTYLPDSCFARPPAYEAAPPLRSPKDVDALVPDDPNRPFDVHQLVDCIVDAHSFFELKPAYAPELVTGLARIGGRVVGIVANNSAVKAGAIFPESSDKAAKFIWTCDAFNVPLLYLCDTPGFMVGPAVEQQGVLRRGRNMIFATSCATVPKVCVVVRKAYGAGIYAMCGPAYEPEATIALPGAEIAIMGPEAAINAVYLNHILRVPEGRERQRFIEEKRAEYRRDIDVHVMASDMVVDHVVPPSDLRDEIAKRFEWFENKEFPLPERKHGTIL